MAASWKEMLLLFAQIKDQKVADALFIWKKMKEEKAFLFTATPLNFDHSEAAAPNTVPAEVINTDTLVITHIIALFCCSPM